LLARVIGDESVPRRADELEAAADEATIRALRRELEQELGRVSRRSASRSEAAATEQGRGPEHARPPGDRPPPAGGPPANEGQAAATAESARSTPS
jgi:hypothetical protein